MKRRNAILLPAAALLLVTAFHGCRHKDLWYGSDLFTYVRVVFDWSEAPIETKVSVVDLHFFPDDGKTPFLDQKPKEGGEVRVPYGLYRTFAYNSDRGTLLERDTESYDTYELYTRDENILSPLGVATRANLNAKGAEGERVVLSPEEVWCGREPRFDVVFSHQNDEKVIPMHAATHWVLLEIRGVKNFSYLSGVSCALSGLAEGYLPGPDRITEGKVTIPFAAVKMDAKTVAEMKRATSSAGDTDAKDSIFGELWYFGHCPVTPGQHYLTLYAILSSGEKFMYTYDVTDQMHRDGAEKDGVIRIVIEDLPLPVPISNGDGLNLTMDDWEGEHIEINMGKH